MNRISPNHPCFRDKREYRRFIRQRYLARRERTAWIVLLTSCLTLVTAPNTIAVYYGHAPIIGLLIIPFAVGFGWAFTTLGKIDKDK